MTNQNIQEPKIMEVNVHPHLVGAVQTNIDLEGNKRFIPSNLINIYEPPSKPENSTPMTEEEVLEAISHRVAAVGMFSSRFVKTDEFTRVYYEDSDENLENKLFSHLIENADTIDLCCPHDRISCHVDNEWIFKCFQIVFWHQKELLSHQYLNLPSIINIKRSSGEVQKGIINPKDALIVRKGSKDIENKVYIKVHFSCQNPQSTNLVDCNYNKLIYFKDFLELNPEFKTLQISFPKDKLKGIDLNNDIKKNVVEKVMNNYKSWFSGVLIPCLEKIDNLSLKII